MSKEQTPTPLSIHAEAATTLGDLRRTQRMSFLLEQLSLNPQASLPSVFNTKSELEGAYRFFSNSNFSWKDLEEGCASRTAHRASFAEEVLLIHDTTDISFKVHDPDWIREYLTPTSSRRQGFCWHAAFAVANTDVPLPLGLLASLPFVHKKHLVDSETKQFWVNQGGVYENETQRWFDLVKTSDEFFGNTPNKVIHLMDREADSFSLLNSLIQSNRRFVIRVKTANRKLATGSLDLSQALAKQPFVFRKTVHLGFRTPLRNEKKRKAHPPRKKREALLEMRAMQVTIPRGRIKDLGYVPEGAEIPENLSINVVEAVELNPPKGQDGVRWLLWTTEPINSTEDLEKVVDLYRRRWVIEEFFKAIKTGCKLEERQLRSAEAILKMLLMSSVLGWWLLATRGIATSNSNASWRLVLPSLAFGVLRQTKAGRELTKTSTVVEVLYAVAGLGGHIKSNGPPGWQTLLKGMNSLAEKVDGARLFAAALGLSPELPE